MRFIYLILPALLAACASSDIQKATVLTSKGKEVEWVKRVKDSSCEEVGQVVGINESGSMEMARTDARNKVGELDGNLLLVKDEVVNGKEFKIFGVAYRCP